MLNTFLVSGLLTFPAEAKFAHNANLCCHQLGFKKKTCTQNKLCPLHLASLFLLPSQVTLRVPPLINVSHKAGETESASKLVLTNKLCFISSSLLASR